MSPKRHPNIESGT